MPHPPTAVSRRGLGGLLGTAGAGTAGLTRPANAATERPFRPARVKRRQQPNLLVILGDDLGWADLSALRRSAHQDAQPGPARRLGGALHRRYSASSVCSPTRFGLYTGRYPGRLAGGLKEPIAAPSEIDGIPLDHPTLASLVKGQGYETALFGKWHCGFLPWFSPTRLGWDEFFGNFSGGLDYFSKFSHNGPTTSTRTRRSTRTCATTPTSSPSGPWSSSAASTTSPGCSTSTSPRRTGRGRAVGTRRSATRSPRAQGRRPARPLPRRRRLAGEVPGDGRGPRRRRRHGDRRPASGAASSRTRSSTSPATTAASASRTSGRSPAPRARSRRAASGCRRSSAGRARSGRTRSATSPSCRWTGPRPSSTSREPHPTRRTRSTGRRWCRYLLGARPGGAHDLFFRMRGQRALRRGALKYVRLTDGRDISTTWWPTSTSRPTSRARDQPTSPL